MSEVKLFQSDTSMTPFDSGTYGSRVTFLAGNATRNAAVDAKRKLLAAAGEKWGEMCIRDRTGSGRLQKAQCGGEKLEDSHRPEGNQLRL